jgi:hypothetical protein
VGITNFQDIIVEFENPNISFSQVDKVEVVIVVSDDPDDDAKPERL